MTLKICKVCKFEKEDLEFPTGSNRCFVCKKEIIKAQKLKCYYKNKYIGKLKPINDKSREQRRRSYHKNKYKHEYIYIEQLFTKIKSRAKRLNRDFNLTKEFLKDLYQKQNGICSVTGMLFSDEKYNDCKRKPFSPSLDRINSKLGYTQDNVRFVCSMVNSAIGEFGDKLFDKMCREYVKNTVCSK